MSRFKFLTENEVDQLLNLEKNLLRKNDFLICQVDPNHYPPDGHTPELEGDCDLYGTVPAGFRPVMNALQLLTTGDSARENVPCATESELEKQGFSGMLRKNYEPRKNPMPYEPLSHFIIVRVDAEDLPSTEWDDEATERYWHSKKTEEKILTCEWDPKSKELYIFGNWRGLKDLQAAVGEIMSIKEGYDKLSFQPLFKEDDWTEEEWRRVGVWFFFQEKLNLSLELEKRIREGAKS